MVIKLGHLRLLLLVVALFGQMLQIPLSSSAADYSNEKKKKKIEKIEFGFVVDKGKEGEETIVARGGRLTKLTGQPGRDTVSLLQTANRSLLVHLVLAKDFERVLACDLITDPFEIEAFRNGLVQWAVLQDYNITKTNVHAKRSVNDAYSLLNIEKYVAACESFLLKRNDNHDAILKEYTEEGNGEKVRQKRFLMAPGTYWCGMGTKASHSRELGSNSAVDYCCMEHDGCPYFIPRLSKRYGLSNWRTHTLSYCPCDFRFHTCLKRASKDEGRGAGLIGQLFFNVVNKTCFKLRRQKVCPKKWLFWWSSTCPKTKTALIAYIDNTPRF